MTVSSIGPLEEPVMFRKDLPSKNKDFITFKEQGPHYLKKNTTHYLPRTRTSLPSKNKDFITFHEQGPHYLPRTRTSLPSKNMDHYLQRTRIALPSKNKDLITFQEQGLHYLPRTRTSLPSKNKDLITFKQQGSLYLLRTRTSLPNPSTYKKYNSEALCTLANFTKTITNHYELKTDWGKTQQTMHFFSWMYLFSSFSLSRTLEYAIKRSLHWDLWCNQLQQSYC